MAISTAQVTVSTTVTKLSVVDTGSRADSSIAVAAPAGADLYVGDATVTATTGFRVPAGATFSGNLESGEDLYGVLASGSGTAYVFRSGV